MYADGTCDFSFNAEETAQNIILLSREIMNFVEYDLDIPCDVNQGYFHVYDEDGTILGVEFEEDECECGECE